MARQRRIYRVGSRVIFRTDNKLWVSGKPMILSRHIDPDFNNLQNIRYHHTLKQALKDNRSWRIQAKIVAADKK